MAKDLGYKHGRPVWKRLVFGCLLSVVAGIAAPPRDFRQGTDSLLTAHESSVARIEPAVKATWTAIAAGKHLFAADGDAWGMEAIGRAAGMSGVMLYKPELARPGDVVWFDYNDKNLKLVLKSAHALERYGCVPVLFGPKPKGEPPYPLWVDSLNAPGDDNSLVMLGNVVSLWEVTGELVAAASRDGKRLGILTSYLLPEAKFNLPAGIMYDPVNPPLPPISPQTLALQYLASVRKIVRGIDIQDGETLKAAAGVISAGSGKVVYTSNGHLMQSEDAHASKHWAYINNGASGSEFADELGKRGVLFYLGYVPEQQPFNAADIRQRGNKIIWSGVLPADLKSFLAPGEIFIDQHWQLGDCGVSGPGTPCTLPISGVAALYLLERLRDLTGDSSR